MMSFSQADLNSTVAPIGHNDISVGVHGHAGRSVELSVPLPVRAKLKQELPVGVVHLEKRLNRKQKWGAECLPNGKHVFVQRHVCEPQGQPNESSLVCRFHSRLKVFHC